MTERQLNARDVAVMALRDREGNVSARLVSLLERNSLGPADRALARELSLGTVRRQATLDSILRAFLNQPGRGMPGAIREILEVGLYQILFLDRVPDFAAVNEAVAQAERFHHRRQGGLVNGVLRSIVRELADPAEVTEQFAPDAVPVADGLYRRIDRAVFADGKSDPVNYLAQAHSLPPALAARWIDRCGGLAQAVKIARHANTRPPLILRINRLKADLRAAADALAADDVETFPHVNGVSLVAKQPVNVRELKAFRDGWFQPQDAAATAVVIAADPKPGMRVLDFCAAPGTKTTHLAELMDNTGEIAAVDVSADKLERIDANCRRLGVDIVTPVLAEQVGSLEPRSFDLALVDAPCSNTGVLARRPEARWRFDERQLGQLASDQRGIASLAAEFVRPGGTLVYSTCSIEPEECQDLVRSLLDSRSGLSMVREESISPAGAAEPARWSDGGYFAILAVR